MEEENKISNETETETEKEKEKEKVFITNKSNLSSNYFTDNKEISIFECAICKDIPNPYFCIEVECCGHLFCENCLEKWFKEKPYCPICKKTIKNDKNLLKNIKENNKIVFRIMNKLNIKCPYNCNWSGNWEELENHLNTCLLSIKECKYKNVGCEFFGKYSETEEHEKNNDKKHLELAMNFINKNKIDNRKYLIKFDIGQICKVSCHDHPLTFRNSMSWACDGRKLSGGCLSKNSHFKCTYRYRCHNCDFDLCTNCMNKYAICDSYSNS
jgi:hypothetical protein